MRDLSNGGLKKYASLAGVTLEPSKREISFSSSVYGKGKLIKEDEIKKVVVPPIKKFETAILPHMTNLTYKKKENAVIG